MSTNRFSHLFKRCAVLLAGIILMPAGIQAAEPEIYLVPNVVDQFNKLALRPEALGFSLSDSPEPSTCRHYQGLARKHGPGTPYMFVTRSGNDPGFTAPCPPSDPDDGPGNLLVVRMDSRDATGERLRSNRLLRDSAIDGFVPTPPDSLDTVVAWFRFDGQNEWPAYMHPGGVQLVGDVLVVALDKKIHASDPEYLVVFIDVSDPESPQILSRFAPEADDGSPLNTTVVGVTPVANPEGPGVRYLMIATGGDNSTVTFWRSRPTQGDGSTDLKNHDLQWERVGGFTESSIEFCMGGFNFNGQFHPLHDWPTSVQDPYQTLNFVREESGALYLIGANNELLTDNDLLDLYRVNIDAFGTPDPDCPLTFAAHKHVTSKPIMGGGDSANFAAASGVYVSPSGELIVYATEYENDGPVSLGDGRKTVRFGEWRHREIVRPDSPTLRPSLQTGVLYEVEEGALLPLAAQAQGPITKAWIQLFEDEGLGLSLPGLVDSDQWLVVDFEDWGKDNFEDFRKFGFNNQADSIRWFLPSGCALRLNQRAFSDADFPGVHSKILHGFSGGVDEPVVKQYAILNNVPSDEGSETIGDTISSVQFSPFLPECDPPCPDSDAYYAATMSVAWDLGNDGTFETSGASAVFPANDLDGPAVRVVLVRAQHPLDLTFLGQSDPIPIRIEVRNVPPRVESFALVDFLGVPVPFALLNLEYAAQGTFTDPGKPDRQTATLDWGDGTIELSAAFDLFTDAFGGVVGQFKQSHVFTTSGPRLLQVHVRDDDEGQTTSALPIEVLTPLEALDWMLQQIDALLAGATDGKVIKFLLEARDDLDGNQGGAGANGAIDKLAADNSVAALVKIEAFVVSLIQAQAAGAGDLTSLKHLAAFIAESIAQAEILRVIAALPVPSPGQATQIQRMEQAVLDGHQLLVEGDYLGAIDQYIKAASRL